MIASTPKDAHPPLRPFVGMSGSGRRETDDIEIVSVKLTQTGLQCVQTDILQQHQSPGDGSCMGLQQSFLKRANRPCFPRLNHGTDDTISR